MHASLHDSPHQPNATAKPPLAATMTVAFPIDGWMDPPRQHAATFEPAVQLDRCKEADRKYCHPPCCLLNQAELHVIFGRFLAGNLRFK